MKELKKKKPTHFERFMKNADKMMVFFLQALTKDYQDN
jgi:hypothetical protein